MILFLKSFIMEQLSYATTFCYDNLVQNSENPNLFFFFFKREIQTLNYNNLSLDEKTNSKLIV